VDPATLKPHQARQRVGLVPQTPADLLYLPTVAAECEQADRESGAAAGACRALLDRFVPGVDGTLHPADLSEGQRLALVLAIQLVAAPAVLLLDEPTRGLDYAAKVQFGHMVRELAGAGRAVVLATHDVEFVAACADRVVVLAEGEIVADGPTADVVVASPAFAPQVAKVLAPQPWLTAAQVAPRSRRGHDLWYARHAIALPVSRRSVLVLTLASVAGLAAFFWPLLITPRADGTTTAPFVFLAVLPLLVAVVLAEVSGGGLDAKAVAMLSGLGGGNVVVGCTHASDCRRRVLPC
jgi:energy-coupling factor transporter ATP-binding protein EcfA2